MCSFNSISSVHPPAAVLKQRNKVTATCIKIKASNRNEYLQYLLTGKSGRCVGLTILPPSRANCLEIWDPKLLKPSGPVQACTEIALSVPLRKNNYHTSVSDRFIIKLTLH